MEMTRRLGAGRLAEVLGVEALDTDRFMRTLDLWSLAATSYRNLDPGSRQLIDAYVAGVNGQLSASGQRLPPEFLLLRYEPEPWTAADSLVWLKLMALDLSTNWAAELFRMQLGKRLTPSQIKDLYPSYGGDEPRGPTVGPVTGELLEKLRRDPLLAAAMAPTGVGLGSNNWAVDGRLSASGKPLLANDPHLRLRTPSIWYFAHLNWPGQNLVGATLPGLPSVVLGRNDRIAWSFANTGSDVQDLYIELIDAERPDHYLTPDGSRPFDTRLEVIKVRDGPAEEMTVRATRHGPVLSDVLRSSEELASAGYVLALAWTGLREDDLTIRAGLKIGVAKDWDSFLEAVRDFHTPQQNIIYADVDGNIGFVAPARVPIRKPENRIQGFVPQPGWDAAYDWDGFVPFDELPRQYNPPSGVLLSANHKIVADDYPHYLTSEWALGYRAERIRGLLTQRNRHSLTSFQLIQRDVRSLLARDLLPFMLTVEPATELARTAHDMLQRWDYEMNANRPEPLIFAAWHRELTRQIYADELGSAFGRAWGGRARFLSYVLKGGGAAWCDNVTTEGVESCNVLISQSLERAVGWISERYGNDPARWRWGDAHRAIGYHVPFSQAPYLSALFEIEVPSPGGTYTVNVGHYAIADASDPFVNIHAPSMRAIYDLDDLDRSLYIHSTGQSGNPLSDLHDNFVESWANGEYVMIPTKRAVVDIGALGTLVLESK